MTMRQYRYNAIGPGNTKISDLVSAENSADAVRLLARDNKTVLDLREVPLSESTQRSSARASRKDALIALQQLAVMVRARIELLEALEIIATSLAGRPVAGAYRAAAQGLRRGDRLASALRQAAPFYPNYVFALIQAGEASGRLATVLEESAEQMAHEQRITADIGAALVYPGFLVVSGMASVGFLFYVVVPRFAAMLRNARADLSGLSAFVVNTGVAFHDHAALVLVVLAAIIALLVAYGTSRDGREALGKALFSIPGLRSLFLARQRASWSRIMSLALAAGLDVLDATALAASALPNGKLKRDALAAIPALRSGRPVDEAFLKARTLSVVDASLVRAGQRSGAMDEMFRAVADRNDNDMRDALKRFTLLVEPAAIAIVASMIGAIVLGLVSALASIYDSIG